MDILDMIYICARFVAEHGEWLLDGHYYSIVAERETSMVSAHTTKSYSMMRVSLNLCAHLCP